MIRHFRSWLRCPACGRPVEGCTNLDEEDGSPEPGDIAMCMWCGGLLCFTDDMTFRIATPEDLDKIRPTQRGKLARLAQRRGQA